MRYKVAEGQLKDLDFRKKKKKIFNRVWWIGSERWVGFVIQIK